MTPTQRGSKRVSAAAVAILLASVFIAASCSTTVVPPRSPIEPVTAFLLDHGDTPSLVLPKPDGNMTRYVYGDWNWYALRNTGLRDGLQALFWSPQATLGRRDLMGPAIADVVRQRIRSHAVEEVHPLTLSRADVERLRSRLDEEHRVGAQRAIVEALDLQFVPHPRRYSYFHNSNHMVASWLRELGCEIHGLTLHSRWRVERHPEMNRD